MDSCKGSIIFKRLLQMYVHVVNKFYIINMVRNYKKKKNNDWTEEQMKNAISMVHEKKMSACSAAKKYDIPKTTLLRHLSAPNKAFKVGKPTALSYAEEREIVATCHLFVEWGFSLSKQEVMNVVGDYMKANKKANPFRDNIPGRAWWVGFLRRHPDLVLRKPEHLQLVLAQAATSEIIDHWFTQCLKPVLEQLDLFDKPHNIFNADETGFPLSGNPGHVLAKRGMKSPQTIIGGSGRDNITVLACASATGKLLPPFVVYTGKHLMASNVNGGPFATKYSVSDSGWMTKIGFLDWFQNLFIPSLTEERPVLLIIDGHSSHISYNVRQVAKQNDIHMLKLPPHLTHLLQPMDVGVFKPLKASWYKVVSEFTKQQKKPVTKKEFPSLLKKVWDSYKEENAINGFKKTGIHPFDKDVIPASSLAPSESFHHLPVSPPSVASSSSAAELVSTSSSRSLPHDQADDQLPLRNFFSQIIRPVATPQPPTSRRRVCSLGESLTAEEVMERLAAEEEAKMAKEKEKEERKRKREEKKQQTKHKKARHTSKSSKSKPTVTCRSSSNVICLVCEMLFENDDGDDDWIQCESCDNWYHVVCVGLEYTSSEELKEMTFVCDFCDC